MRCLTLLLCVAFACFTGCGTTNREHVASDVTSDRAAYGRPTVGMPIILPQSHHALVPFTLERALRPFEFNSDYGVSSSYVPESLAGPRLFYFRPQTVLWHNLIFQDQRSGETRLLLDRKAIITQFTPVMEPLKQGEEPKAAHLLLYGIADNDTDGDGIIHRDDAVVAYVSGIDGGDFRRATPEGTQLWNVAYDFEDRVIYFIAVSDSNSDRRFTMEDRAQLYRLGFDEPGPAVQVVDDAVLDRAEAVLKR